MLILGALEILVRAQAPYFYALSDKLLLKAAILERSPDTRILFLGTSRFVDSIEQQRFTDELEALTGQRLKSLNGATTGAQGERSAYFAKIAAKNQHLTHVILEASPPALMNGKLGFKDLDAPDAASDEGPEPGFAKGLEYRFQQWAGNHIALVKYRKALRLKTLLKLPVLYLANFIDPNTWSRKGLITSPFTSSEIEVTEAIASDFVPTVISAETLEKEPLPIPPDEVFNNMIRLSEIFADSGIEVIWVAPPVSKEKNRNSSGKKYRRYYEALVSRYDTVVYDYAGLETDETLLRDSSHMNAAGRHVFSTLLARQLADRVRATPE